MSSLPALIQKHDAGSIMGQPLYTQLAVHIPHVSAARRRLFPTDYIVALAEYRPLGVYTLAGRVSAFTKTAWAHQLQTEATQRITRVLDNTTELTTTQVAELLCVSREAVANWYESGALRVTRSTRQVRRKEGAQPREFITASTAELRRFIVWHLPIVTR